jgi:hypothetical protein
MGLFKREIEPVEVAGKTRFEVENDPSGRVFNSREEAEDQRSMLDTFNPLQGNRRR